MTIDPFRQFKSTIEAGDLSRSSLIPIHVEPGKTLTNKYGIYPHTDMIGQEFGSQMLSKNGRGFIFLLHPTPELWTLSLPHRTQILYAPDIAFVSAKLRIRPDTKVIESGTGSGSFTHSFARAVGPSGRIYTYEFHELRCITAQAEFEKHGLTTCEGQKVITLTHRDVCKNGFALEDDFSVEAIFLDLPAPWEAIPHLDKHLSSITRLCCFCMFHSEIMLILAPCIEQVQRTVATMRAEGWVELECYEIAAREWESRYTQRKDINDAIDNLRTIKRRRAEKIPKDPPKDNRIKEGQEGYDWIEVAKSSIEVKSHTSFLVFAMKHKSV